jgi:Family of unknown function (DUF6288)
MDAPARLNLLPLMRICLVALVAVVGVDECRAQVHYHPDGNPWRQRANAGPDAEVPGWYYNLGLTGMRVELVAERPQALLVRYVFADSPAAGKVEIGDWIVGVEGQKFAIPHRNGYGMDKFGADGPIADFARALEACQTKSGSKAKDGSESKAGSGKLPLLISRDGKESKVQLKIGKKYGAYSSSFPTDCKKSDRILEELLDYLVAQQNENGSWGSPPHDTFAPLALMSSKKKSHRQALLKNVRMHAKTTSASDDSWLINWRYMSAGIVLSEYYLLTHEKWLLKEIQEVYDFLISSQFVDPSQINPKSKETHPHAVPKSRLDSHGGWGHNPGFEGYGPISMLTAQGALTFALMKKCGIEVDPERHQAAYAFLKRASGKNYYVWYEDQAAGADDWADMGRTGTAAIAHQMSPWSADHQKLALHYAEVIGMHPQSFPDTHGSPIMGMAFGALGASCDPIAFRDLMDANQWWFTLAQCADGSFYYQPNRDNAGYGADSRISASAAVAFILSIPKAATTLTGRPGAAGRR